MKYLQMKIYADRAGIELLTGTLMSMGIDGVSIDDPEDIEDILARKNEYGWDYMDDSMKEDLDRMPSVTVYFDCDEEGETLASSVREKVLSFGFGYEEEVVDDSDWKDRWKEFFKPARITDRITVKPTWEEYEAHEGELVIEIDPGMAFGTGTHETTSLCMKLMEEYLSGDAAEKSVLDVGCGSGILSIGAALLGSCDVLGIEIDEDAVGVAKENIALNDAGDAVKIVQGDLVSGVDFKADIIVANLMADLVMSLAESAAEHLEPGGIFISSGILVEKKQQVASAITRAGFRIKEIREDGEWCAIAAEVWI